MFPVKQIPQKGSDDRAGYGAPNAEDKFVRLDPGFHSLILDALAFECGDVLLELVDVVPVRAIIRCARNEVNKANSGFVRAAPRDVGVGEFDTDDYRVLSMHQSGKLLPDHWRADDCRESILIGRNWGGRKQSKRACYTHRVWTSFDQRREM
jgi:hypothetical protein